MVRLHASSGTTGKPIVVAYTREDVDVWTTVMVRSFADCGLHQGDIIQNAYGYGLFTGGLGAHYGAEGLGATVIPISGGNTDRQIMVMKDFGVTAICCTPSYFLHMIDRAAQLESTSGSCRCASASSAPSPGPIPCASTSKVVTGIQAFDIYGLSEIIGPGVAVECPCQDGLHIFEDHFYPEIIDPETGEALPDGEEGELVLTTLSKRAMPMIRYRTRDITALVPGALRVRPHLAAHAAHRPPQRRHADHSRRERLPVADREPRCWKWRARCRTTRSCLPREHGLDQMEVQVEVTSEIFSDKIGALEELTAKDRRQLEHVLGIRVEVTLVEPHTIQRSEGKAKRVMDRAVPS